MKFLFHAPNYKPAYGGPLETVRGLAEGLIARGHEAFVATGNCNLGEVLDVDPEQIYDCDGVKVRYFPTHLSCLQRLGIPYFSKSAGFLFDASFKRWLATAGDEFDVFHTHMAFLAGSSSFSGTAKRLCKIYFYHQHGNLDPIRLKFRRLKKRIYLHFVEKPVMRRANVLIALTAYEAASYRALGLTNRVELLPNGIDPSFDRAPSRNPSPALAALLQSCGDQPVFLYLSRIHPLKGPHLFLNAFLRFAKTHDCGIGIMAGPDEFGLTGTFQKEISARGLSDRFHLLGATVGSDKIALLDRADAFVLPSSSEGFAISLLEALMFNCAVITTPGAHFNEIEETGAGFIVDASEPGVLRGLMEMSRLGRRGMAEMGKKGKRLVMERFTWPAKVERYEALAQEFTSPANAARTQFQQPPGHQPV